MFLDLPERTETFDSFVYTEGINEFDDMTQSPVKSPVKVFKKDSSTADPSVQKPLALYTAQKQESENQVEHGDEPKIINNTNDSFSNNSDVFETVEEEM